MDKLHIIYKYNLTHHNKLGKIFPKSDVWNYFFSTSSNK